MAHHNANLDHLAPNPFQLAVAQHDHGPDLGAIVMLGDDAPQEVVPAQAPAVLAPAAPAVVWPQHNALPVLPAAQNAIVVNGAAHRPQNVLGQGNFGSATRYATDDQTHDVVVKQSLIPLGDGQITNEATALAVAGNHPNVAQGIGQATIADRPAVVTELLGDTVDHVEDALLERLRDGDIDGDEYWGAIKYLLRETMNGVNHLGGQGIVHRDIKGANACLDEATLRPKLIDFGNARPNDGHDHAAVGTAGYMAPEQAANHPGHKSDVYSVGAMGVRAIPPPQGPLGQLGPFAAATFRNQQAAQAEDAPQEAIPFKQFMARLLAEDPAQRPTAAEALADPQLAQGINDVAAQAVIARRTIPNAPPIDPIPDAPPIGDLFAGQY